MMFQHRGKYSISVSLYAVKPTPDQEVTNNPGLLYHHNGTSSLGFQQGLALTGTLAVTDIFSKSAEAVSSKATLLASIYAPDISDKRGEPNGANITQRPLQEPSLPELPHPKEQNEEETESRQDHNQERVEKTPADGVDGQLSVITTGFSDAWRTKLTTSANHGTAPWPRLRPTRQQPSGSQQGRARRTCT